jgi:hypothetical protein
MIDGFTMHRADKNPDRFVPDSEDGVDDYNYQRVGRQTASFPSTVMDAGAAESAGLLLLDNVSSSQSHFSSIAYASYNLDYCSISLVRPPLCAK